VSLGLRLYVDFVVFLFGAAAGSFFNVCIHRMPREESIVNPPSHCPKCNQPIRWHDNIPLVSFFVLRGKCRHCGGTISPRYLFIELLTASLFLAVWLKYEFLWVAPIYWVLIGGLIVSTFIDFERFIIPNEITYGGIVTGLMMSAVYPPLLGASTVLSGLGRSVVGLLAGSLPLYGMVEIGKLVFGRRKVSLTPGTLVRIADGKLVCEGEEIPWGDMFNRDSDRIRFQAATLKFKDQSLENVAVRVSATHLEVGEQRHELAQIGLVEATTDLLVIPREAMGLGDVKFIAAIGAFLGWEASLFTIFSSSVIGGAVGLLLVAIGKKELHAKIPYGPYIALAALLWIFFGREVVDWYFGFLQG